MVSTIWKATSTTPRSTRSGWRICGRDDHPRTLSGPTGTAYSLSGQSSRTPGGGALPEQLDTPTSASPASSQFSPDGSLLAHTNHRERQLRVWEVPSARLRFVTETGIGPTSALAFSPDGALLAGANGDTDLYVWSAQDGKLLRVIDELQTIDVHAEVFAGRQLPDFRRDRSERLRLGHANLAAGSPVRAAATRGDSLLGSVPRWTCVGHRWPGYHG